MSDYPVERNSVRLRSGQRPGYRLAVASLVLGIVGLMGLPLGPLALGMGLAARRRLGGTGDAAGVALAAIVVGVCASLLLMAEIGLLLFVVVVAAHLDLSCLETGAHPCWH